ncbi:DNA topoisomerase III [Bacillus mexicanus]|uniref:DNA topoisomerase III n=1 Tax=Bacillus mexicanus TaxID=2834415 RepID=UPI003D20E912
MKLVIAEKPDMAKTYANAMKHTGKFVRGEGCYKNNEYIIVWAYGHLVNSKEPGDYPNEFGGWNWEAIPFVPPIGKLEYHLPIKIEFDKVRKQQLNNIKKIYKQNKFEEIINGCDPGREGDLIGNEIIEILGMEEPVKRLWVQSPVEEDIRYAFENLRDEDFLGPRRDASYARQFADWVLGNNLTIAFSVKVGRTLHVGRVQTPTLSLLVNRRLEIESFKPKDYFEIKATFGGKYEGIWFKDAKGNTKIDVKQNAENIINKIANKTGTVVSKDVVETKINPKELFDLASLQSEANKKFGFTMQKTLDIAQLLYDKYKVLSYPRTDSKYIMSSQVAELPKHLEAINTPEYKEFVKYIYSKNIPTSKKFVDDKKVTDHFALIPTKKTINWNEVTDEYDKKGNLIASKDDIRNIYDMVVRRFLAVFYPEAIYEKTEIVTKVEDETFKTNGRILKDPGWEIIYGKDINKGEVESDTENNNDKTLPPIEKGEEYKTDTVDLLSKQTKPKPHYTEGTLGTAMENAKDYLEEDELKEEMKESKAGLGTSATRAAIIENLIKRKYIIRKGKQVIASDLAVKLIEIAPDRLKSPEVTAQWERELRLIEEEQINKDDFNTRIVEFVREEINELRNKELTVIFESEESENTVGICPKCNQPIIEFSKGFACKTTNRDFTCFRVWKGILNKTISRNQLNQILKKGETNLIKNFKSKSGKTFDAKLKLKDAYDGLEFVFPQKEMKELDFTCPKCSGKVYDRGSFIHCETNSKESPCFSIPKEFFGKKLSLKVIKDLALKGRTDLVEGFKSKTKKTTYSAYLIFKNDKVSLEFPERKQVEKRETDMKCPSCGGGIIEMEKRYGCSNYSSTGCKFTVWKNIGGKQMTLDLIKDVINKQQTEKLDGFVSKAGKAYSAKLVWNEKKNTIELSFD